MAWTSFSLSRSFTCEPAGCAMNPLPKCHSSGDARPSRSRVLVRSSKDECHCRSTSAAFPDRFPTEVGGSSRTPHPSHGQSPKKIKLTRRVIGEQARTVGQGGSTHHRVNSLAWPLVTQAEGTCPRVAGATWSGAEHAPGGPRIAGPPRHSRGTPDSRPTLPRPPTEASGASGLDSRFLPE